jgi:hypothetical protein
MTKHFRLWEMAFGTGSGQRMGQRRVLMLVGVLSLVLSPLTGVRADQLFHSVRLSLDLTLDGANAGHPALRTGHVLDIHPNGPINGAHERYQLNGAKPNTAYDVVLRVFTGSCSGPADPGFDPLKTLTLTTNQHGNASGKFDFPATAPLPAPIFFGVRWTVVDNNGVVAYDTDCITVGLD